MENAKEYLVHIRYRHTLAHCWKAFFSMKSNDLTSRGKEFLRTLGKYYIVDIGLRNYLLGFRNRDSGHAIENVIYFELLDEDTMSLSARSIIKKWISLRLLPIDKCYIQVTESMQSEDVRKESFPAAEDTRQL